MLKQIRIERNLTQKQLSEKTGIPLSLIQHYEQGFRNLDGAKLNTLLDLAIALDCSVSDIVIGEELKNKCKRTSL